MSVAGAEPLWRAIAVYRFASIGYAGPNGAMT
jgi:hypothetical protein